MVAVVLLCHGDGGGGDSFKEDLCCWPKLGVFVDLVELDGVGVTLLKTVEALTVTFFFSTIVFFL